MSVNEKCVSCGECSNSEISYVAHTFKGKEIFNSYVPVCELYCCFCGETGTQSLKVRNGENIIVCHKHDCVENAQRVVRMFSFINK